MSRLSSLTYKLLTWSGTSLCNQYSKVRLLLVVDEETAEFIIKAETQLFQFRFSCLTEEEIYKLLKSTQKHVHLIDRPGPGTYNHSDIHHVLYPLLAVKEAAQSWRNVAHKYMQEKSGEWFEVPFQAVLSLVGKRLVDLRKGFALVAYDDLEEVLTGMFESVLRLSLKQTREIREAALQDVRMRRLASLLTSIYRAQVPISLDWNNLACLSHDQVDQSEALFPLCMSNLHETLRAVHRLNHNDRIQYSLFLKEAGMPVHQAIRFWKQEYSQSSSLPGTCQHSWQKDERRYVYSIRHLYGLEGARRNYRGHCCASLQRRQLGPFEQGGCPFVHFDNEHLSNLLRVNQISEKGQTAIMNVRRVGHPCSACNMYLRSKIEFHLSQLSMDVGKVRGTLRDDRDSCCESEQLGPAGEGRDLGQHGTDSDHQCEGTSDVRISEVSGDCDKPVDSAEVMSDSSDEDVIFVSLKSRQGSVKRRSLSTKAGCKKRMLWYETGTGGVQTAVRDREICIKPETSDGLEQIGIQRNPETNSAALCLDRVDVDLKIDSEFKNTQLCLKMCSEAQNLNMLASEKDALTLEISSTTLEHVNRHPVSENSVHGHEFDEVETWSKGENSVMNGNTSYTEETSFSVTTCRSHSFDFGTMENEINDGVSCYEHEICPSQVESSTQRERKQKIRTLSEQVNDIQIHKPVDFFTSFKDMMDGLKALNNKQ